jgi:hypothetical protein
MFYYTMTDSETMQVCVDGWIKDINQGILGLRNINACSKGTNLTPEQVDSIKEALRDLKTHMEGLQGIWEKQHNEDTNQSIDKCIMCNDYDIAKAVYCLLQDEDVKDCSYKNLSNFCSTKVSAAFMERSMYWNRMSRSCTPGTSREICEEKWKVLCSISTKMKQHRYKSIILKELKQCFV